MKNTVVIKAIKKEPNRHSGLMSDYNSWINDAWARAEEIVKNDPTKAIIPDIESMYPIIVSKDQHQKYVEMWESFTPKSSDGKLMGEIQLFGTGGALDDKGFTDMFTDPDKFK